MKRGKRNKKQIDLVSVKVFCKMLTWLIIFKCLTKPFHQNGTDDNLWFLVVKGGVDGDTLDLYHIPLLVEGRVALPIQLRFLVDQGSVLKMHAKYYSKIDRIKVLESELAEFEKKWNTAFESAHNNTGVHEEWQTSYDQLVMIAAIGGVVGLVLLVMVIMLGITGCRLRKRKRAMTAKLEQMKVDEQVFLGDHVIGEQLGKGSGLKQGINDDGDSHVTLVKRQHLCCRNFF